METHAQRIPDFGLVIERPRLTQVFFNQNCRLTVICAPPGYGKSVLASQLAGKDSFDRVLWVPLYDRDVRNDEWLLHLARALEPPECGDAEYSPSAMPAASASRADTLLRIREGLRASGESTLCLVLDGCNRINSLQSFEETAELLCGHCGQSSCLVVTCRSIADSGYAPDPAHTWAVDEHDLRFGREEVRELMAVMGAASDASSDADGVLERFSGHPALTSLVLRHSRLDDCIDPPQDLVWHTRRLVSQLSDDALGILYVAAILREGSASEIGECLEGAPFRADWVGAQGASPLLTIIKGGDSEPLGFRTHAVLCDAVVRAAPGRLGVAEADDLRSRTLMVLSQAGDYVRLLGVLTAACPEEEIGDWCESNGSEMMYHVGPSAVDRCLGRIPPARVAASARLLLLRAAILREQERYDEAFTHASLARRLAELHADRHTRETASLLTARLSLDTNQFERVRETLEEFAGEGHACLDTASECMAEAYMATVEAISGDIASGLSRCARARDLLEVVAPGSSEAISAANCIAAVEGQCAGRWDQTAAVMRALTSRPIRSPLQRIQCRANLAVAQVETGSISEALLLLDEVLSEIAAAGLRHLQGYALGTRSSALYALGDVGAAYDAHMESRLILDEEGDDFAAAGELANAAVARRALGLNEESLALAETAFARLRDDAAMFRLVALTAETEIAASLLSLGDLWGARRIAARIRAALEDSGALAHLLRVDLVFAEADRADGNIAEAIDRLSPHAEYLATGSANWLTAMYVRAFPGLLGLLASAMGADNLPLRMLRLVPEETLDIALGQCEAFLHEGDCAVIRRRVSRKGDEAPSIEVVPSESCCRVRLFGCLEVNTGAGVVSDDSWRKRKARLLFVMLVLRQGQDLPRDVIMERLWPDMDEEHAKRNFYVTWSTMKRALACGEAPSRSGHLVRCSGGVCRLTALVRSDLDDFDEAVSRLRAADTARDSEGVLAAARDLMAIYRGELLPGDVYEEWFAETRDRVKHDFCDAMMSAARIAEAGGDPDAALPFLRRASAADPWREDIYQSTMRCQMSAGQRSRAIETYLSCRSKLVDDLGIDPSVETTRLYQAVLAMEDDG